MADGLRPPGPDDLARQVALGQLALDPAGELVVCTRRTVVDGRDRIALWAVPYAGGASWPLTDGAGSDHTPRFAPDGRLLAFVRAIGDEAGQLHVVDRDGGTPRRLTDLPHGVADLAWLPDGRGLVVLAEDARPPGELSADAAGATPVCQVVVRLDWRADDEDALPRRPRHLHRVGLDGGAPVRLTAGPWSAARPRVAPDGTVLALADPRPDADRDPCPQVHRVGAGGRLEPVTALAGGVARYAVADGGLVVLGWTTPRPADHEPPAAFHVPLAAPGAGPAAPRPLAPGLDRWPGQNGSISDLHDWGTDLDDAGTVTGVADDACVVPCRLGPDGAEPLVDPALRPLSGALAAAGGRVVATLTLGAGMQAPEVFALEPGGPRRLTDHGSAWLEPLARPEVEVLDVDGPAGPIRTMLVHPPGAPRDRPLATVLCVHGGPTEQWGVVPPWEALLLAGAGYRVALPNVRGSYDRGSAWVAALAERGWGTVDADDAHAVLDRLVADGLADPARLGVSGLSYGGFLVNWLVATSDRFAAAVSENGVTNQVSAWGTCDVGPVYARAADLGEPFDEAGAARLWRASPLRLAREIRTPLLLLQAADDQRCPASDAEQLFSALRWLGRPVQYVRYPEERHLFQGLGRFDRRLDRHRRVLAWFAEHLPA